MMVKAKDMMQSKRHHIIHTSFPTLHHHTLHRFHKTLIQSKRLAKPFTGNPFAFQERIPCQTAESIPVGL